MWIGSVRSQADDNFYHQLETLHSYSLPGTPVF